MILILEEFFHNFTNGQFNNNNNLNKKLPGMSFESNNTIPNTAVNIFNNTMSPNQEINNYIIDYKGKVF